MEEQTAQALFERAAWSATQRHLEADLRSDLAQVLVPYAENEVMLPAESIRQEGSGLHGRFDSMFGSAIIEYKAPRRLRVPRERELAAEQALGYLQDPRLGARVVIVTDGELWGILRDVDDDGQTMQLLFDFGEARTEIPAVARFAWRPNSASTATAVLDLIASQRAAPVSSRTIISFMGPGRGEVLSLLHELAETLGSRISGSRSDTLLNQWVLTAGIAYGISDSSSEWPPRQPSSHLLPPSIRTALGNRSFAETIFCLHTYVALASKLIAAEVLAIQKQLPELRPTQWRLLSDDELIARLVDLEGGGLSEQLGAPGLLVGDVFDWYAHDARSSRELVSKLRSVLSQLDYFAWAQVANAGGMKIDLLRDLYQSVVPRGLRKALGEFFTPRWLSEYVLVRALSLFEERRKGASLAPRVLDPSCGSGTFLVAAMRAGLRQLDIRDQGSSAVELQLLVDRVVGIDINPVSALMSRVNLLLTLGDRLNFLPEVSFRVYHADSIVLPRAQVGQLGLGDQAGHVIISTAVRDFRVHASLMTQRRMGILRENLEAGLRERSPERLFLGPLEAELRQSGCSEEDIVAARTSILELYAQLSDLRDVDRDDVWARVLEQFLAPQLIEEADLVIGNPPWVSWKNLPDAWKARSEPLWRAWGLWRTRRGGQGIPLSDISTLMVARAICTYAPNGLVAMLLPKSVQLADPGGNAFRRSHLRPDPRDRTESADDDVHFAALEIDDFAAVNPFAPDASNQTIVVYIAPNTAPDFPIRLHRWRRQRGARLNQDFGWGRVEKLLTAQEFLAAPVDPDNLESPWGVSSSGITRSLPLRSPAGPIHYRFGRGFETRGLDGLFTFEILRLPAGSPPLVRIANQPDAGMNTQGEQRREGVVEPNLLWPLVKGEDVARWRLSPPHRYLLVPYDASTSPPSPVGLEQCASRYPRLFRYLQPWLARFAGRSMYQRDLVADFPWALSGPVEHLRADGALVFVRYLAGEGRPAAAVAFPAYDERLRRSTLPLPNNKSNIYYAESPEEAHFLAAFINSAPAQQALSTFAVSTGVTPAALSRLPIPKFNPTHRQHMGLATLGMEAGNVASRSTEDPQTLTDIEHQIDDLVWKLVTGD